MCHDDRKWGNGTGVFSALVLCIFTSWLQFVKVGLHCIGLVLGIEIQLSASLTDELNYFVLFIYLFVFELLQLTVSLMKLYFCDKFFNLCKLISTLTFYVLLGNSKFIRFPYSEFISCN